jgi:hypothetical protein
VFNGLFSYFKNSFYGKCDSSDKSEGYYTRHSDDKNHNSSEISRSSRRTQNYYKRNNYMNSTRSSPQNTSTLKHISNPNENFRQKFVSQVDSSNVDSLREKRALVIRDTVKLDYLQNIENYFNNTYIPKVIVNSKPDDLPTFLKMKRKTC